MSKYAMLNCWDDLNKGDLGIMLATVNEFRRQDQGCDIIGISCFNKADSSFENGHVLLRRFVPDIYPAIFGTLGLSIGGVYRKDVLSKFIALGLENIRYGLCMMLPPSLARYCLNSDERNTLDNIKACDVAFSKGGSVFTDYNSKRGAFALVRLCRFYKLLTKFGIKYYILGQSFGPVISKSGIKATNYVIDHAEHVYIREMECIRKYPQLHLKNDNVSYSNDVGFLIEPMEPTGISIDHTCINVGVTIRGEENDEGYLTAMKEMMCYLINEKKAHVHIFQQVSMDSEPDNIAADKIVARFNEETVRHITYHRENYLPQELCWLYGQMDYFIGTRLHSTIFAMRAGIPALGIVYHGTKTQGIYENVGVSELIISGEITFKLLKEKYNYMVDHREELVERIEAGVESARKDMQSAVFNIIQKAKGETQCSTARNV